MKRKSKTDRARLVRQRQLSEACRFATEVLRVLNRMNYRAYGRYIKASSRCPQAAKKYLSVDHALAGAMVEIKKISQS